MQKVTSNVRTDTTLRGCNPSMVITDDGVVIIDTPQLPTKALAMREEAEAQGPIRYVINTEHHVDHIFGNYYFRGAGKVVHHQGVYDNFMEVTPALDSFDYAHEAIPTDDPEASVDLPGPGRPTSRTPIGATSSSPATSPAGRRPHLPAAPHPGPHPRPNRRIRAGGAGRLHRRHHLLRVPDLADGAPTSTEWLTRPGPDHQLDVD